jgi:glyoxylase-like metal-dependent hydrolase (beta-lactamase superfamily II)
MAHRQERESAKVEVEEVAPGVLRMQLPIRMPGLGHVNCYAVTGSDGVALVDPGLPGPGTWRALGDRLRRAGVPLRHVRTVFVTHSHPDHFGGAPRVARETGAEVVAHRSFSFGPFGPGSGADEVSADDLAAAAAQDEEEREEATAGPAPTATPTQAQLRARWSGPTPWGGRSPRPPLSRLLRWRMMRWFGSGFLPNITHPVEHGDVLEIAGREWFVLHTPGHTTDHVCLHDPETGTLLSGDHVLPTITPHISGLGSSADPLRSYFYSLDRVAEIADVKRVLPAHGHPFDDLRGRAEAIKRHHHERLGRLREIGRELGPATVEAFTKRLFPQRSWGSMAESETYAHLEHLRHARQAERRSESGAYIYETG